MSTGTTGRNLYNFLTEVSDNLAHLAFQVRSEAQAGMTSRNKVAEDVLLSVLRRVYRAPGLVNANQTVANFPGIDLFDSDTGLGVQVTSEVSTAKVTSTIETLVAGTVQIRHLVIAFAADSAPTFRRATRDAWQAAVGGRFAFDPAADVFALDGLFARIQRLPPADIEAVATELGALVRGTGPADLLSRLRELTARQLKEEQRIARYIPDVFVETRDTKYHARCFAHPALFLRRIVEWFGRSPLAGINQYARMAGVPELVAPDIETAAAARSVEEATAAAAALADTLRTLEKTLDTYRELDRGVGVAIPRDPARAHAFDELFPVIQMQAGGLAYRIGDRRTELACAAARGFILVGRAGQGKTNFLCDFVERFLLPHGVPCAYVTTRALARVPASDLTEVLSRMVFPSAIASLDAGLDSLAAVCAARAQPFVLVIDGLNEHPDVSAFARQLEHLLEALFGYSHVRVIMTCRSEFVEQRFGALLQGPLRPFLHVSEAHGHRLDDEQYDELVERYFAFFRVQTESVSERVRTLLRKDVLLLRFFCETYGARGREAGYRQPVVTGVYRDEIFRTYVRRKLEGAGEAVAADRATTRLPLRRGRLERVLQLVTSHMFESGCFADVPLSVIPPDLDSELAALLDEELVLRRDIGAPVTVLSAPEDVLNFTFDELRDFLLAQYLREVHAGDPTRFRSLLDAQEAATAQTIEGVQRFLFYAARVPEHAAFLESYRSHRWYDAVYDTEVFHVVPSHLTDDDRLRVRAGLASGGHRAEHFARELALAWQSTVFPVLNLELLLAFADDVIAGTAEGLTAEFTSDSAALLPGVPVRPVPAFFEDVVATVFGRGYGREASFGEEFCGFVESEVLPRFSLDAAATYEPLFRLIVMLLPVRGTRMLDSPAMTTFRQLAATHPEYATRLVREALLRRNTQLGQGVWNEAHLWRLLGDLAASGADVSGLIAAAEAIVANAGVRSLAPPQAGMLASEGSATDVVHHAPRADPSLDAPVSTMPAAIAAAPALPRPALAAVDGAAAVRREAARFLTHVRAPRGDA